ncbi:hypothetical protein VTN31DRAFT_4758 [Thermomyces dupontii]|uniref:uncharacterized protein n=1 Tax=Talaromyces thermophilus TaxID=28565 RepID=UPI00374394FB
MSDTAVNNPPEGSGSNKRKREDDNAGPDAQRVATTQSGGNTNVPALSQAGENQATYSHSLSGYEAHGLPSTSPEMNIDQQILQHVGGSSNGITDENALSTAKAALAAQPQNKYPPPPEAGFDGSGQLSHGLGFGEEINQSTTLQGHNQTTGAPAPTATTTTMQGHPPQQHSTAAAVYAAREAQNMNQTKPAVGSPEWHALRKNNHKEVERRRRETINEGINQIAQLVPNCDKNKGAILQRAIEYIVQLQEERKQMNTRWEQNNLTTTQALNEISAQNAKLKAEVNRRGEIARKWLQRARDAGLEFDDYEDEKELGPVENTHNTENA